MKIKSLIAITLICVAGIACKNTDETCYFYPTTAPLNQVSLKFVDKTTGADLIFGAGAPYKFSDLKVTGSTTANLPRLFVDSVQKSAPFITMLIFGQVTQSTTLQLGALPADTINIDFNIVQQSRCYSYANLNKISLDSKTICSPCSMGIQLVTIAK